MARLPYPFNPARFTVDSDGSVTDERQEFVDRMVLTIDNNVSSLVEDAGRAEYRTTYCLPVEGDRPKGGDHAAPQLRTVLMPAVSKPEMDEVVLDVYERLAADRYRAVFLNKFLYGSRS